MKESEQDRVTRLLKNALKIIEEEKEIEIRSKCKSFRCLWILLLLLVCFIFVVYMMWNYYALERDVDYRFNFAIYTALLVDVILLSAFCQ